MKLVKVVWYDTNETSDSGWVSMAEAKKDRPCKVASVGWLVNETDKFITIAADIDGNDIEEDKEEVEEKNFLQWTPGLIVEAAPIERIKKLDLLIKRQHK